MRNIQSNRKEGIPFSLYWLPCGHVETFFPYPLPRFFVDNRKHNSINPDYIRIRFPSRPLPHDTLVPGKNAYIPLVLKNVTQTVLPERTIELSGPAVQLFNHCIVACTKGIFGKNDANYFGFCFVDDVLTIYDVIAKWKNASAENFFLRASRVQRSQQGIFAGCRGP